MNMDNKRLQADRAKEWLRTLALHMRTSIEDSVNTTCIYKTTDHSYENVQHPFCGTLIHLMKKDTIHAAFKAQTFGSSIGILNFASYRNPGGGFLKGSVAQEEFLCSQSTLYPALDAQRYTYYAPHVNSSFYYKDEFIHTEEVTFFSEPRIGSQMLLAHVITAAATNHKMAEDKDVSRATMVLRMNKVFQLFSYVGCDTIVLGAWGCGVFGHDPDFIAEQWKQVIRANYGSVANVVFAVPDNKFEIFKRVFKDQSIVY